MFCLGSVCKKMGIFWVEMGIPQPRQLSYLHSAYFSKHGVKKIKKDMSTALETSFGHTLKFYGLEYGQLCLRRGGIDIICWYIRVMTLTLRSHASISIFRFKRGLKISMFTWRCLKPGSQHVRVMSQARFQHHLIFNSLFGRVAIWMANFFLYLSIYLIPLNTR